MCLRLGSLPVRFLALSLFILALATSTRAWDDPPALAPELLPHQGTWRCLVSEREGQPVDPEIARSIERTVEGDRVVWSRQGQPFAATGLRIDPHATPYPALEVIPEGGPRRGQPVHGLFRFDASGCRLTLVMADPDQPRPTSFETPPDSRLTLLIFERIAAPEPHSQKNSPPSPPDDTSTPRPGFPQR